MPTLEGASSSRTISYRYEIGVIKWAGRQVHAVVISGFPLEGGREVRAITVNRILAENTAVVADLWAVFIRRPRHLPEPEWELIGAGYGTEPFPDELALPPELPEEIILRLEDVFSA